MNNYRNITAGEILQGLIAFSQHENFDIQTLYKLFEKIGLDKEYSERNLQQIINNMTVWKHLIQDIDPVIKPTRYSFNPDFKENVRNNIHPEKRKILEEISKEFDALEKAVEE